VVGKRPVVGRTGHGPPPPWWARFCGDLQGLSRFNVGTEIGGPAVGCLRSVLQTKMKGVVLRFAEVKSGSLKQTRPPRRVALPLKSWSALSAWDARPTD